MTTNCLRAIVKSADVLPLIQSPATRIPDPGDSLLPLAGAHQTYIHNLGGQMNVRSVFLIALVVALALPLMVIGQEKKDSGSVTSQGVSTKVPLQTSM